MLIGINGFKGAGKDTLGKILVDDWGFTRFAFADKMKQAVAALIDVPYEEIDRFKELDASVVILGKPMSFRVFLQRFGTEMGREVFGEDFWVELVIPKDVNTGMWHFQQKYVITDARFENELRAVRRVNGFNVRVLRDGLEPDGHASEVEPQYNLIDYHVINNASIRELEIRVSEMLEAATAVEREELGR